MSSTAQRRSRWRLALAVLVGHLVATYAFCAAFLAFSALAALLRDPGEALAGLTWGRSVEGVFMFPLAAGAISLFGVVLMIPFTLLGLAVGIPIVRRRRSGVRGTCALGGAVGMLLGFLLLSGVFDVPRQDGGSLWASGATLPAGLLACCAVAGAAFGYTLWRLWLRPVASAARPV